MKHLYMLKLAIHIQGVNSENVVSRKQQKIRLLENIH
jgi:hypothetical protein